jgi:glycosyltransferase involved in cell wall biosynthesis
MMYHGTLTKIYGLDIAIEAFSLARKEMPGAEMWILGDGPEQIALEKLAQERGLSSQVKLLGFLQPAEVPSWLSKCDVGVLPIRRDKFLEFASPNKLSEYIINGKPVIVSRLKAIRYYFGEDALAYFEPNDPADLARQMIRIYRDKGLGVRLAARAKAEYAPLRWEIMKQRYLNLIEEMIGPAKRVQEPSPVAEITISQR